MPPPQRRGLTLHPDARAFLDAVTPALAEHEAEHHLVLGIAGVGARRAVPNADLFAATVDDDAGLVLAALIDGGPLLLASDRDTIAVAARAVLDRLDGSGRHPRRVIGAIAHAAAFVEEWEQRTGRTATLAMRQRAYQLTTVRAVPGVSGKLRVASASDVDLVASWVAAFEHEALGPSLANRATRSAAEQRIAAREVFLWCDPEPRAMAGSARPTARGIAVNAVYTPPQWRGRGYATACVAELSARLLAGGRAFCVLYTDLANPTSNAIYARIGYRPVRDFSMYELPADSARAG